MTGPLRARSFDAYLAEPSLRVGRCYRLPSEAHSILSSRHPEEASMDNARYQSLVEDDLNHWVHPLYHPDGHQQPILIERGEGIYVYDQAGRRYIDGLAALWNVAVGHGRRELGEAAAKQMATLSFSNAYEGYTNEPAIRLAKKVVGLAYPNMQALYFTNSGSESNETNFKAARFYWNRLGRPKKHKIITRVEAYHGNTIAMTSATGMKIFHGSFGPKVPNIINADTPGVAPSGGGRIDAGNVMIDNIVAAIEREGPDSVAAVIAEPVQGAGGVYPPPADYFSQLRDVCDRYEVLLIADEVITGFGRTGKWFALEHFGVQPDMMSIAKAITSGYVPMGAAIFSERVHEVITSDAGGQKFMHAYTNAGHATAAAVGLRNLQIFEDEGLVANAAARGDQLLSGLRRLSEHPHVGNVRGLGFMCGFDLLKDPDSDTPYDLADGMGIKLLKACQQHGLISRVRGDAYLLAPPLVATEAQVNDILSIVETAVREVTATD